jgi:transposase
MLLAGSLDHEAAAAQLDLSLRQLRRLVRAYRAGELEALRHGNAGRAASHAVPDCLRARIVDLARTRYASLNQTELTQRLASEHGIALHRTTIRRILADSGMGAAAQRRRPRQLLPLVGHRCLGRGSVAGCRCD